MSITPLERVENIGKEIGINNLYIKREDLHPFGSHKGRSIPLMIDSGIASGSKSFAISSSGNAGLSAIKYIKILNKDRGYSDKLRLSVFVGRKIDAEKLADLKREINNDFNISINISDRPIQALHIAERNGNWSLRQSTDPHAPSGYDSLAEELSTTDNLEAVYVGASSGTTALGLINTFARMNKDVKVNIVQTEACHSIADEFDKDFQDKPSSIAGAIVDKVGHRRNEIIEKMEKGAGSGFVVSDEIILEAISRLNGAGIKATPNGALALAGLLKASKKGYKTDKAVVCILGGK